MPIFQSNAGLEKPFGSEVQLETLPELYPPRHYAAGNGAIILEDDAAYAIREATWAAKTRTITVDFGADGGVVGLKETTTPLAYNATPATIQAALEAMAGLAPGDILVSGAGRYFEYAFSGAFANKGMKRMYSSHGSINQVQTESNTATGGSRTYTFKGVTTGPLNFDATNATVQTAIQGLSTVGAGNITVSGPANALVFTFAQDLSGAQPLLTVDPALLTGGTAVLTTTTAGSDGIRVYFETVVMGVSQNAQRAIRQDYTDRAINSAAGGSGTDAWGKKAPADIGNPARYNPDGSPNQQ
jgi:hypothetical protein